VVGELRRAGVAHRVIVTRSATEGYRHARRVAAAREVVAVLGGDGTINAVGAGLAGGSAWLAPLPGGTENVLCREMGLPVDPVSALGALLRNGRPVGRDVGLLNGRPFLLMAGIGFDGAVAKLAESSGKRVLGRLSYHLAGVRLLGGSPTTFSLTCGRRRFSSVYQAVFSIGPGYGGGLMVNHGADPADRLLDCAVFRWKGHLVRLVEFASLWRLSPVRPFPPCRLRIRRAAVVTRRLLPAQVDGDPVAVRNPVVSVSSRRLWVLQPAKASV